MSVRRFMVWLRIMLVRSKVTDQDLERQPLLFEAEQMEELHTGGSAVDDLRLLWKIIAPECNTKLLIHSLVLLITIALDRCLNPLVPRQQGLLVDSLVQGNEEWLNFSTWMFLRLAVLGSNCMQEMVLIPVRQVFEKAVMEWAHRHIMAQDLFFHTDQNQAEVRKAIDIGMSVPDVLEYIAIRCVPQGFDMLVSCIYINYLFGGTAVLIMLTVLVGIVCGPILSQWTSSKRKERNDLFYDMVRQQFETVKGWETVMRCNQEQPENDRFKQMVANYQRSEYSYLCRYNITETAQHAFLFASLLPAFVVAIRQTFKNSTPAGKFVTLLSLSLQLLTQTSSLSTAFRKIANDIRDLDKARKLARTRPRIEENTVFQPLPTLQGEVSFHKVSFKYPKQEQWALRDVSFNVGAGGMLAIVGESGGGKTTILRLLTKFFLPVEGEIQLDQGDLSKIRKEDVRRQICSVSQNTDLFHNTIEYNVSYGAGSVGADDIVTACKAAQIHDTIIQFPKGYEEQIGNDGSKLSGGGKQRILLARCFLQIMHKKPRIVFLDEPTSALDAVTEAGVLDQLQQRLKDCTCIMVAHRLQTIKQADQIIVLDKGSIAEQGKHKELIMKGGKYADMWRLQHS